MKKHDIFTFKAPNGVEVTAVVVYASKHPGKLPHDVDYDYVSYAQNRLFTCSNVVTLEFPDLEKTIYHDGPIVYGEIICDYCIIPDYDSMLERYSDIQVAQAETAMGM